MKKELHLAPIMNIKGKDCYFCPIRNDFYEITTEETERQAAIEFLVEKLGVPVIQITILENSAGFGVDADSNVFVVWETKDGIKRKIALVECCRESKIINDHFNNAIKAYAEKTQVELLVVTNGAKGMSYRWSKRAGGWDSSDSCLKYSDMIDGAKKVVFKQEAYVQNLKEQFLDFFRVDEEVDEIYDDYEPEIDYHGIYYKTPLSLAIPALNLSKAFLNDFVKFPIGDYGLFQVVEDKGVYYCEIGNASGGIFPLDYRVIDVMYEGELQTVFLAFSSYFKTGDDNYENGKTSLNVGLENSNGLHHSLQMSVERNWEVTGNRVKVLHDGRIAVGNMGSGNVSELREIVLKKNPKLIYDKKFFMGAFSNDRELTMEDPEVIKVVSNLISYALIRDDYRIIVKNRKKR